MKDTESRVTKKRARTISNLTEEQIQQKRNVDRKAQRAFRQRTKDCIASLEQQVFDLQESSKQREYELQQDIQKLRKRDESLLRSLENIAFLMSSTIASYRGDENSNDDFGSSDHVLSPVPRHPFQASVTPNDQSSHPMKIDEVQDLRSPISVGTAVTGPTKSGASRRDKYQTEPPVASISHDQAPLTHVQPLSPEFGIDPVSDELRSCASAELDMSDPSHATTGTEDSHTDSTESYRLPDASFDAAGSPITALQITPNFPSPAQVHPIHSHITAPISSCTSPNSDHYSTNVKPVFTVLPAHVAPTCPLDQILLGFLETNWTLLSQGALRERIVGEKKASVKALIHTELAPSVHPVVKVMSEVMSTYLSVGKPEQLALFYLMHQTMRWQISPTKESYFFMPKWLRPTVTQITVPHAAWIDNVPWPGVRDLLIEYPEEYPYQLWTENFTQNVSVGWKFDVFDALMESDHDIFLHSIFEKHVRKLSNWTVSEEFLKLFPNLKDAIYSPD